MARSKDGVSNWRIDSKPSFVADPANHAEEAWGIEDPRVTWIEDRGCWIIAYTAYSPSGPLVSLAETKDFTSFQRIGAVMPPEEQRRSPLPPPFGNRYAMIHRPVAGGNSAANIWISFSPDLNHWGGHQLLLRARTARGGTPTRSVWPRPPWKPPKAGWSCTTACVTAGGCLYRLGLALLDLEDPRRVLRRGDEWVFAPETPYERQGDVGGVVFPCGWILTSPAVQFVSTTAAPTLVWPGNRPTRRRARLPARRPEPRGEACGNGLAGWIVSARDNRTEHVDGTEVSCLKQPTAKPARAP